MRISASTSGFYPAPTPIRATRNPVVESSETDTASVRTAADQAARQLAPVPAPASNSDSPRVLISAPSRVQESNLETSAAESVRGRSDFEGLNAIGLARQSGRILGSRSASYSAQRGAAEYAQVATQEHRDELVALLGIDVFA